MQAYFQAPRPVSFAVGAAVANLDELSAIQALLIREGGLRTLIANEMQLQLLLLQVRGFYCMLQCSDLFFLQAFFVLQPLTPNMKGNKTLNNAQFFPAY